MATVSSVALTQPSSDPNINEAQTFTIGLQITKATHGGLDYNPTFQWDQGLGDSDANYADIATSGADLTIDAQPAANQGVETEITATVTGVNAGGYFVRAKTIDNNDSSAVDVSAGQAVTVNAAAAFTPDAKAFRFYEDGTEAGSSPLAAQDTDVIIGIAEGDVQAHLRVRIDETGGTAGLTTDDYGLEYSKNSGAWTAITASSSNVKSDTASSLTADGATTNRATNGISDPGAGSFVAGEQEETNGVIENHQLTADNFTEHVWALALVDTDLANGDTLDFRIALNAGAPGMTNTVVPQITVYTLQTGVDFDETTPDYGSGVDTSSASDTKFLLLSFWLKLGTSRTLWDNVFYINGNRILVRFDNASTAFVEVVAADTVGSETLKIRSDAVFTESVWHHALIAATLGSTTAQIWVDDTEAEDAGYGGRNVTDPTVGIDWSDVTGASVGADGAGGNSLKGALQEVYITNEYVDISVEANRRKFITAAGKPAVLDSDGSLPTGTQPLIYLRNEFSTFQNNLGSLGNFTENGTLTDEGTLPELPSVGAGAPVFMHHLKQMANN